MASYPGIKATLVTGDVIGKIKAGKVISFAPHFAPAAHIKPAGKSGAN